MKTNYYKSRPVETRKKCNDDIYREWVQKKTMSMWTNL